MSFDRLTAASRGRSATTRYKPDATAMVAREKRLRLKLIAIRALVSWLLYFSELTSAGPACTSHLCHKETYAVQHSARII
jgi:hypothetical protein